MTLDVFIKFRSKRSHEAVCYTFLQDKNFACYWFRNAWPFRLEVGRAMNNFNNINQNTLSLRYRIRVNDVINYSAWYNPNSTWLVTSWHDTTRSKCRAHAFWLCRACQTARIDTCDTTSSTRSLICCVICINLWYVSYSLICWICVCNSTDD